MEVKMLLTYFPIFLFLNKHYAFAGVVTMVHECTQYSVLSLTLVVHHVYLQNPLC